MEGLNLYEYHPYCPCYCEENTYRFLEKFVVDPPPPPEGEPVRKYDLYAAFITSYNAEPGKEVEPGEWQSAVPVVSGPKTTDIVYWDYHCVSVVKETTPAPKGEEPKVRWWVVDFDTKLGKGSYVAPMPMELYFGITLSPASRNPIAMLEVRIRFVPAVEFLGKFKTDRRHMYLRAVLKDGRYKKMTQFQIDNPNNYQAAPPKQPRIQQASPAAGVLKGEFGRDKGRELVAASCEKEKDKEKEKDVAVKHLNNLAQFLNTKNTAVCKSDLVGIKEIGQWIKAH